MLDFQSMLERPRILSAIQQSFRVHPAVTLVGPRQCGKTTIARWMMSAIAGEVHYFDLERLADQRKLANPELTLDPLRGLIVIDEIQRAPELFTALRPLLDRPESSVRFLLTGSAAPSLVRGVSESLAGRVATIDLGGFDLEEVGCSQWESLWLRGGFPRSFLAVDDAASFHWRGEFVKTFLERDLPQLGISIPAESLRRFWTMIAHYHGQVWNGAEFARSLGSSEPTARRYLDILTGAQMVRLLPPWFENLKKRQLKSPKLYIRDSGLLHALLGLDDRDTLLGSPKLGASWEGFALEQCLAALQTRDAYFWGTHAGAELDLLVLVKGQRYGFEFKYSEAPGLTKSMRVALSDLRLDHLWVIHPGRDRYLLDPRIAAVPLAKMLADLRNL